MYGRNSASSVNLVHPKILYTYVWERSSQDVTALICYYVTHLDWWCSWWPDVPSVWDYYAESMFRLAISLTFV